MNPLERFHATLDRKPADRPASWLGIPTNEALGALYQHFGVEEMTGLKQKIGDDIWPIEVPYHYPPSNHIACAFDFAKDSDQTYEERTLTAPGFFEDMTDPAKIADFPWPDPKKHMDAESCRHAVDEVPEGYVKLAILWAAHFQDACAAFGMENAMMTMLDEPEMFRAVIDRILEFYLEAAEIFYQANEGRLDAVLMGNDFGSQYCMMVNPGSLREFVFDGTKQLIDQAKSHGLRVIHHSCGSIKEVVPDLMEIGSDAIHPIQALATGMDAESLKEAFGDTASYCGGVDAQNLLVNGTPDEVRKRVHELRELFPTGLIISPSHEAILPDIPPANIQALFEAVRD